MRDTRNWDREGESPTAQIGFMALQSTPNLKNKWIIDSGASSHMTCHKHIIRNMRPSIHNFVTMGDGRQISIEGVGEVCMNVLDDDNNSRTVELRQVLYVPKLSSSLISFKIPLRMD